MFSQQRTAVIALALGVAVAIPVPAAFARSFHSPPEHSRARDASAADEALAIGPALSQRSRPSGIAGRLAGWVSAAHDNDDLPFMIVDKLGARIFAFDASGRFLGSAPVLVGLARGDDSAPGIGALKLSQISAEERTTPAGRFVARFGESNGHGVVLWVDLRDGIALHPVMSVSPGEHRLRRIKSSDPEEHRISYGCINVPAVFYDDVVLSALDSRDGVVYVLPDTKAIDDVFPAFAVASRHRHGGAPPRHQFSRVERPSHASGRPTDLASSSLNPDTERP